MAKLPRAPRVTIEITDELIEEAIPRDSSHCLWAEAVKVAVPDASRISVDIQTIRYTDPKKGLRYTYLTPRTAQIALIQFDQGIRPEPHSVQLRGGQVTSARKHLSRGDKSVLTEAQLEARKKGNKATKPLSKAKLRAADSGGTGVPVRVGGKTPPLAAGKRRSFGLRGLEY